MPRKNAITKIGWLAIGAALAFCCAPDASAQLTATNPVAVYFDNMRMVFVATNAHRAAGIITKIFAPRDCVLDATTFEQHEKVWCKRVSEESYTDIFREKAVPLEQLLKLRSATISELTNLLGKPVVKEGPIDHEVTSIWCWRTCNAQPGVQFVAIEAFAGFNAGSSSRSNALFFAVRVGRRK